VTSETEPIGFIGVGNMGGAMAERVLSQGGAVVAFDASPKASERLAAAGAELVESAAAVARRCKVISVVVNYDADVLAVMDGPQGLLAGAAEGTTVAIHSTIHLGTLETVAANARRQSITVVDAAVTGGIEAAARGELAILLGGPDDIVERLRPALESYASMIIRCGDMGAGMAAKLALMVISFGKLAATYEGLALASAAGVDTIELAKAVGHSETQSGIHEFFLSQRAQLFASGSNELLAEIARHEAPKSQKDLHAALEVAARHRLDLPLTAVAHDQMPLVWGMASRG
jgi:3-hydroxyisobutyrate dehydrogenase-like beta-hydroxyacid dehydrogenase